MLQLSRVSLTSDPDSEKVMLEVDHHVLKFRKWLPAGKTEARDANGKRIKRKHDLIQFISENGGKRTVRVKDLTVVG